MHTVLVLLCLTLFHFAGFFFKLPSRPSTLSALHLAFHAFSLLSINLHLFAFSFASRLQPFPPGFDLSLPMNCKLGSEKPDDRPLQSLLAQCPQQGLGR